MDQLLTPENDKDERILGDPWTPEAALEPGPSMEEEPLEVADQQLEQELETAERLFGTDYYEVFDSVAYGALEENVQGRTAFNQYGNQELEMIIEESLRDIENNPVLGTVDKYHVFGHEGIHGEFYDGSYGTEMRGRGLPASTLMAVSSYMKSGDESMEEAATEYSARLRNPMFRDVRLDAYSEEVAELESYLKEEGLYIDPEAKNLPSEKVEDVDLNYVDAGENFYIEQGEIEDEEYLLGIGEMEEIEPMLKYADLSDRELFVDIGDYDPSNIYDSHVMDEFEEYLDENIENYEPSGEDPYEALGPDLVEGGYSGGEMMAAPSYDCGEAVPSL